MKRTVFSQQKIPEGAGHPTRSWVGRCFYVRRWLDAFIDPHRFFTVNCMQANFSYTPTYC